MSIIYSAIVKSVEQLSKVAGLAHIQTHTFYTDSIGKDSVIVDLGANVGQFASAVTKTFGCRCYAVEAVSDIFSQIPDQPLISKVNCAISDRNEPITLFLSNNREGNSVDRSVAGAFGVKGTSTCEGMTFETFLRQQLLDSVDLLKVDIEGAEAMLFETTSDDVLRKMKQITIEFHDFIPGSILRSTVESIASRLRALGFYQMSFSYVLPHAAHMDVLFVNIGQLKIPLVRRAIFSLINGLLHVERMKAGIARGIRTARR